MSLFFTLGSTVHDWGWPKNGPFWTKTGQTGQACQHSKLKDNLNVTLVSLYNSPAWTIETAR